MERERESKPFACWGEEAKKEQKDHVRRAIRDAAGSKDLRVPWQRQSTTWGSSMPLQPPPSKRPPAFPK